MTALAEISKAHHMTVASLRGSDLAEFNEAHPRDEAGRFTTQRGGGSAETDPRTARTKRRMRRARSAAGARAVAVQAKARQATDDLRVAGSSSLASLRRERIRPELIRPERGKTKAAPKKQGGKAEAKPKVDLNDGSYLAKEKDDLNYEIPRDDAHRLVLIDVDKYNEWNSTGSLVVGAANERWQEGKPPLTAIDHLQLADRLDAMTPAQRAKAVVIAIDATFHASTDNDDGSWQLSEGQILHMASQPGEEIYRAGDIPQFIAEAKSSWDYRAFADDYPDIVNPPSQKPRPKGVDPGFSVASKADTWIEHEHPRDTESGRFTRLSSRDTPPGQFSDPRIARSRRRQRRGARAAQVRAAAARPAAPAHAEAERPALVRREYARQELRRGERPEHRADPRIKARPEPGAVEAFGAEPPEPPKRKPNRFIPASGEGSYGGRIVTEEEFQRYEAAKKKAEPISNRTPSRSLSSIKRSASVVDEPEVKVVRLTETEHLGREPRYTEDEFGRPNQAWLKYHAARRARKAAPKTP